MAANTLGRYQIIREIARSNDIVYEAVDTGINRRVAVKELLLPPNLAGAQRQERVERFFREARAAGSLSHPNIVTIYEAGEDHGRHFIAMEFLEGQTLRDILEIEGQIAVEKTIDIITQVCEGLSYAHSRGVVHRDIKPDNVQILPSGQAKITDFGIARIMDEPTLTANGQVFGTPSYMSPEQVAGRPLDARTDIFSLGVMLFEMLTGRKPFTGDTVVTITYNIMNQEVTVPPTVPAYLDRVIRRCLAKDPGLRYSSVTEVVADLDPNSFRDPMPAAQPDPFGATTAFPGPQYGPLPSSPAPHQPSSLPPDPFGNLRPGDLSYPRTPRRPVFSPESRYFLTVMLAVVGICAFVIGMVWLLSAGYQGWQRANIGNEVSVHLNAAENHIRSQSYLAAIEEYGKALRLSTDQKLNADIRRNISISYIQLGLRSDRDGNPIQALTYFKRGVDADNTYPDGYLYLGNGLKRMHRTDDALAAWSKAVQLGGGGEAALVARQNMAIVYLDRGDAALQQGDSTTAIGWWRKALEVAPGTPVGFQAQQRLDGTGGQGT